jgi:hypothetical protein
MPVLDAPKVSSILVINYLARPILLVNYTCIARPIGLRIHLYHDCDSTALELDLQKCAYTPHSALLNLKSR